MTDTCSHNIRLDRDCPNCREVSAAILHGNHAEALQLIGEPELAQHKPERDGRWFLGAVAVSCLVWVAVVLAVVS